MNTSACSVRAEVIQERERYKHQWREGGRPEGRRGERAAWLRSTGKKALERQEQGPWSDRQRGRLAG